MAKDTGEILQAYENFKDARIVWRRIFPAVFTTMCVLLFIVPGFLLAYAARHPVVKYFHGQTYLVLLIIPFLIVVAHFYHVRSGPDRYVTHLTLIVPSLILLVFGTGLLTSATRIADQFFSTDCTLSREKLHLQKEWKAAQSIYQSCLQETAASRNLTEGYLSKHFRIQDCSEYEDSLRYHWRDWTYLQQLEEKYSCTGVCAPGEQLWAIGPHKDACSIAVASVFQNMVHANCMQ